MAVLSPFVLRPAMDIYRANAVHACLFEVRTELIIVRNLFGVGLDQCAG
jgi:hypothetical protein